MLWIRRLTHRTTTHSTMARLLDPEKHPTIVEVTQQLELTTITKKSEATVA